jgi:hypothetical protein
MKIVFMIPEGQSHWHDGEARVANDIVETDENTARRLIARGIAAEIDENPTPTPKVIKAPEALLGDSDLIISSDSNVDEKPIEETEPLVKVDEGVALSEFPKVE